MTMTMPDHTWTEDATGGRLETHDGDFVVDATREGAVAEVRVRGELDVATARLLRELLDGVYARHPDRVEVDLSAVPGLDAHAVMTLVAAHRRFAGRGSRLVLRDPSPVAVRVLALTGPDRFFEVAAEGR